MDSGARILIAEDYTLIAEGLRKLLETEFPTVDIVDNGRELLNAVRTLKPDVALVDVSISGMSGIEVAKRITEMSIATRVIILTTHSEREYVVEAFRAGASAYVLKRSAFSELLAAIRQVLSGHSYVSPLVAQHVVAAAVDPRPRQGAASLTARQREVLQLVAEGYTAKEIANSLNLSVKTAVFHKMAIMDKLGLRTTAELTRYAIEHGIAITSPLESIERPLVARYA